MRILALVGRSVGLAAQLVSLPLRPLKWNCSRKKEGKERKGRRIRNERQGIQEKSGGRPVGSGRKRERERERESAGPDGSNKTCSAIVGENHHHRSAGRLNVQ